MNQQRVTMTEVAELADTRRPTVSNWRRRHRDFPQPVEDGGQQPLFDADEVAAWLDRRPLPPAMRSEEERSYGDRFRHSLRLRALTTLRSTLLPGDQLLVAGVALTALRAVTGEPLDTDDLAAVRRQATQVERAYPAWAGLFTTDLAELPTETEPLVATVEELVADAGPKVAVERLFEEADRLGAGVRATMTPPPLADLVAALIGSLSGRTLYDPAAGSGTLLLRLLRERTSATVLAADNDPEMLRLLRQRLLCHDLDIEAVERDSLADPPDWLADVVVVDPPFVGSDPPPSGLRMHEVPNPLTWARQAVEYLTEEGRAYVLVPSWALTRSGAVNDPVPRSRKALIDSGALKAVIQLPRRVHTFRTGTELALLELTRPGPPSGRVLMGDADRVAQETGDGWQERVARILGDPASSRSEILVGVPASELARSSSLLPGQWLAPTQPPASYADDIGRAQRRLAESAVPAEPPLRLPVFEPGADTEFVTIGALKSAGRLQMLAGRRVSSEHIGGTGYRVLGSEELTGAYSLGSRRISESDLDHYAAGQLTCPGDVVVLPVGGLRTLVDEEGGGVVVHPAQALRISEYRDYREQLRRGVRDASVWMLPHVLAALLETPPARHYESGSLTRRVALDRVELPALAPEEVDRLDTVLADLVRRRRDAVRYLVALDRLSAALAAGVAGGALRVDDDGPAGPPEHG